MSDYDPEWPQGFEDIAAEVWPVVQDVALRIDHVGATAVAGLAAKPIIDLDVVVASEAQIAERDRAPPFSRWIRSSTDGCNESSDG